MDNVSVREMNSTSVGNVNIFSFGRLWDSFNSCYHVGPKFKISDVGIISDGSFTLSDIHRDIGDTHKYLVFIPYTI